MTDANTVDFIDFDRISPEQAFNIIVEQVVVNFQRALKENPKLSDGEWRDHRIGITMEFVRKLDLETKARLIEVSAIDTNTPDYGSRIVDAVSNFAEIAVCNEAEERAVERGADPDLFGMAPEKTSRNIPS